jgi:DNA-binding transcriptional ArsR family regulator
LVGAEVDFATAIGNPWRCRILAAASGEGISPSDFVREYGGEISNISRHFRNLANWGYLEVAARRSGGPRRGGTERVYRLVDDVDPGGSFWSGLSELVRRDR